MIVAAVLVGALVATSNQPQADAAGMKTYQVYVTLQDVPPNPEALIMNVTLIDQPFFIVKSETLVTTVASPSNGQVVKFTFKVPSGGSEDNVFVCGTQAISQINDCDVNPLSPRGPIRVDYSYPQ
jgi:hypothetical protein